MSKGIQFKMAHFETTYFRPLFLKGIGRAHVTLHSQAISFQKCSFKIVTQLRTYYLRYHLRLRY